MAADTAVVCSDAFYRELAPWRKFRIRQGRTIAHVSNEGGPAAIQQGIRKLNQRQALRFVVLVGDVPEAGSGANGVGLVGVPTTLIPSQVVHKFGSEPEIATDNFYADLDDDQIPDVALGRITADSPSELQAVIAKIFDYEMSRDFTAWRRRIHLVAGVGGFGGLADSVLERVVRNFVAQGIPSGYSVSATYASWASPLCPGPRAFHDTTIDRLNEGCLFWVYIGHGSRHRLDRVRVPGKTYHILGGDDVSKMHCKAGAPIAVFLACYTGAFDDPRDCLAEEMLRTPGAPVAVVCGSRVTMPYAMTVMGSELMQEVFVQRRDTIGEALLHAKRGMMLNPRTDERSQMMDSVARMLNPDSKDLEAERQEHLLLFHLIGDPLLSVRQPEMITVSTETEVSPGGQLNVTASSPVAGSVRAELVLRRDRMKRRIAPRQEYDDSIEALDQYKETYLAANDRLLAEATASTQGGEIQLRLQVPPDAKGPAHVVVYVQGNKEFALGSTDVTIRKASAD
jgi:hypothetical protein